MKRYVEGEDRSQTASDLYAIPSGISLAAGTTVGLGHVLFDVSLSASAGAFAVNFDLPTTTLTDLFGSSLAVILLPGEITIAGGAAVPEPSSLLLLLACAMLVVGFTIRGKTV